MDVADTIIRIVNFILGFVGALGVLLLFPLLVLGVTFLVISINKDGETKKKFKFWGIASIILSVGMIFVPMILYALLNVITTMN